MKFLDPDTESAVRDFLARIPAEVRLEQAILFGSRARGERRPDSDADVALILRERGDDGITLMMLAELAYYAYLDTGIMVQPVPIAIEDWLNPEAFPRPGFLRAVAREGIVIERTSGKFEPISLEDIRRQARDNWLQLRRHVASEAKGTDN